MTRRRLGTYLLLALSVVIAGDFLLGKFVEWRSTSKDSPKYGASIYPRIYPAPYSMSEMRPFTAPSAATVNTQGFRHPVEVTPTKERPRVFVLGGSFAFGQGASGDSTYYLAYVRQRFPDIEFVNASSPSFLAVQEWILLGLKILPLEPDGIIVIDGFNDVAIPLAFGERAGSPFGWSISEDLLGGDLLGTVGAWIRAHSNVYRILHRVLVLRRTAKPETRAALLPEIQRDYLRATTLTYETCQGLGLPVWHVFQPHVARGKPLSEVERRYIYAGLSDALGAMQPQVIAPAKALADSRGIPYLDLANCFAGHTETIYLDYCHVNDTGHRILGTEIADFLERTGFREKVTAAFRRSNGR